MKKVHDFLKAAFRHLLDDAGNGGDAEQKEAKARQDQEPEQRIIWGQIHTPCIVKQFLQSKKGDFLEIVKASPLYR